jgi:hypothetical protein
MCLVQFFTLGCGVVIIVIIIVACYHVIRGIIAVPAVGVPAIPVVAPVCVAGPVTAETDEDKPAMVVRPEITKGERRPPVVANGTAAIRPGNPVENPVRGIMVTMIMVITSAC